MFTKLKSTFFREHTATIHYENKANNKRLWYIWSIVAIVLFLVQASTAGLIPSLMQDESQITDYGRLALDPLSRWSVTWWVASDKPIFLWSYVGPVLAEIGYQLGGASGVGPRIMALLGGLAASYMALGWLLERKVPSVIAAMLSLAFMLDPLFTLSQRMARSDSWVMAFCLASCWLLCRSSSKHGSSKVLLVILSGILASAASFVWPSAVFLYPLIFLQLVQSIYVSGDLKKSINQIMLYTVYFCAGALFAALVLIIPIRQHIAMILGDMKSMVALNIDSSKTFAERALTPLSWQPWSKLIKAFAKTLSPGLPVLAIWALFFRREKGLVLMCFVTLSAIFITLVYEFRLLYLIPYCLAITGVLFSQVPSKALKPAVHRISVTLVYLVALWAIGISIFLRSALAFNDRTLHDRALISEAARSAIGQGNYKVFLAFTYEFYFTGRSLGWQLYTPYIQFTYDSEGNWIRKDDYHPKDKFLELMSKMDYAIFPIGKMNDEVGKQLQLSGLEYLRTIHITDKFVNRSTAAPAARMNNIFLWFLRGSDSYGPYLLYSRPQKTVKLIRSYKVKDLN
jgi:hypothetical protein